MGGVRHPQHTQIVALCLWSGWPDHEHSTTINHHDTKVKLLSSTAVIELLMMGGKTPETC
jgi:hypothetical protein